MIPTFLIVLLALEMLILLFYLRPHIVKRIPERIKLFKPLILVVTVWVAFTFFDILQVAWSVPNPNKIGAYWMLTFLTWTFFNVLVSLLLGGFDSLIYFVGSQCGIMLGIGDLFFFVFQGKPIPEYLSYAPPYFNTNIKLILNFVVVSSAIILMTYLKVTRLQKKIL